MPIIRRKLEPNAVYPTDLRYNTDTGTIQSLINGTWTDNPDADPRNQTTFPPLTTSDPRCDSAENVRVAFKAQIDGVLAAIDGSQTAFTIAGIILSLFTFGVFGVFIALALFLAHAMLDAGTAAINASLTSGAYDQFMCILYCHMDSSGRLEAGALGAVESDITAQVGGLGATILNAMVALAGEGGINNLGSIGTSTGDCSDCDCNPCDLSKWSIWSGAETYGVIVSEGSNFILADLSLAPTTVGEYFLRMKTAGGVDDCCLITHIQVIVDGEPISGDGSINLLAGKSCGGAQDGSMNTGMTTGTGAGSTELNSFYIGALTATRVKIFFSG